MVDPAEVLDTTDPGDETLRNFRYQNAYGVILLIASTMESLPYRAIWCEHHEDFLAERDDGLYDGYQIKTKKPENGAWKNNDEDFVKSIKRFVALDLKFPGKIHKLFFVSNADLYNTESHDNIHHSPLKLLTAVETTDYDGVFPGKMDTILKKLSTSCNCDIQTLHRTLRRVKFIKGPDRDNFDSIIAHDHISRLEGYQISSPATLNTLRDELISWVYRASSIQITEPNRHWCVVNGEDKKHPKLQSKKITIENFRLRIAQKKPMPFRYMPGNEIKIGSSDRSLSVLEEKMLRGGLDNDFIFMMQSWVTSTERHLMELGVVEPERMLELQVQLTNVVLSEYLKARLVLQQHCEPYGSMLLNDMLQRLERTARERADMIGYQEEECLYGIVGLLTTECKIWWSSKFVLEGNQ